MGLPKVSLPTLMTLINILFTNFFHPMNKIHAFNSIVCARNDKSYRFIIFLTTTYPSKQPGTQIREPMSGPDLHVFTLKFLALKKNRFFHFFGVKKNFFFEPEKVKKMLFF